MSRCAFHALLLVSGTLSCVVASSIARAATESVIVDFGALDSYRTAAGLVADSKGNLYGSTSEGGPSGGAGVIFELTPPSAGQTSWTKTVIYILKFGTDGSGPVGTLAIDAQGDLYGATAGGGLYNYGQVFKLTPPPTGAFSWTKTDLYDFTYTTYQYQLDGAQPMAGVVLDANGNLYGTTEFGGIGVTSDGSSLGYGIVYKLTPPAAGNGGWAETILHRFHAVPDGYRPKAGVIIDSAGALYGTTTYGGNTGCLRRGCGVVFKLNPPAAGSSLWTTAVLHRFAYVAGAGADGWFPLAGLVGSPTGVLYGTTEYGGAANLGTAFALTPPKSGQGAWTETILHSFAGVPDGAHPAASLLLSSNGALTSTTVNGGTSDWGTVFALTPPANSGNAWTETELYRFQGAPHDDGAYPAAEVISDASGNLYGTTAGGGTPSSYCYKGTCGVAFELTP